MIRFASRQLPAPAGIHAMHRALSGLAIVASLLLASPVVAAPPGGSGGAGHGGKTTIKGAGQRLHYSFGGLLVLNKAKNKANGEFSIIVHPSAPMGDTLSVTCRYKQFDDLTIAANTMEVDARGKCTVLHTDGTLEIQNADNHSTVVDNPTGTDSIDVEVNGSGGIAIPGGALSFGGFTITSTHG